MVPSELRIRLPAGTVRRLAADRARVTNVPPGSSKRPGPWAAESAEFEAAGFEVAEFEAAGFEVAESGAAGFEVAESGAAGSGAAGFEAAESEVAESEAVTVCGAGRSVARCCGGTLLSG
jgi:hypothetical protein